MQINGVTIVDTFAEAFDMWAARLIITAETRRWALIAAQTAAGLAVSVIGCGCEAGLERQLSPAQTPDGRPGWAALLFARSEEDMGRELLKRISQGVLPAPTSACYNGLASSKMLPVGAKIRFFGDGYQSSKLLGGRRFWRIPAADGEFIVDESFGLLKGIGGGNLLILAEQRKAALEASEAAISAIARVDGAITPFPGGICRSPSKIGSRYKGLVASTNDAFCPTLRERVKTSLPPQAQAAYEIVIDGLDEPAVAKAMQVGALAACRPGVVQITAGNYGGKLGPYHFHLHQILERGQTCG